MSNKEYLDKEISSLTQIPVLTLQKINKLSGDVITHLVAEHKENGDTELVLDIGYGDIRIEFVEEAIHYKFIPNKSLQDGVLYASTYGSSQLELRAEKSLSNRIKETYRELL